MIDDIEGVTTDAYIYRHEDKYLIIRGYSENDDTFQPVDEEKMHALVKERFDQDYAFIEKVTYLNAMDLLSSLGCADWVMYQYRGPTLPPESNDDSKLNKDELRDRYFMEMEAEREPFLSEVVDLYIFTTSEPCEESGYRMDYIAVYTKPGTSLEQDFYLAAQKILNPRSGFRLFRQKVSGLKLYRQLTWVDCHEASDEIDQELNYFLSKVNRHHLDWEPPFLTLLG